MSDDAARLGFAIGGAAIGAYFGYAGAGFLIGSLIGGLIFGGGGPTVTGPRLSDLKVSLSQYGDPINIVYGTIRVGGTYIWATDIVEQKKTETEGGKGGGGTKVVSYTYYGNFAIAFAEPITEFIQIFADGKLIVDFSNLTSSPYSSSLGSVTQVVSSEAITGESAFSAANLRLYLGTEEQNPDPLIESVVGVGMTPAYRGLAYAVFDHLPLENFGNRIPQITATIGNGDGAFPQNNMTTWTANTGTMLNHPNGVWFFDSGSSSTSDVIISPERQFLTTVSYEDLVGSGNNNGNNYQGPLCIGIHGYVVTRNINLSGVAGMALHDSITGGLIGRGEHDTDIVGTAIGAKFFGINDEYIYAHGVGVEDNQCGPIYSIFPYACEPPECTFTGPALAKLIGSHTTNGAGGGFDLGYESDRLGDHPRKNQLTGQIWFMVTTNGGTDTLLVRCGDNGLPEEEFVISGIIMVALGFDATSNAWILLSGNTLYRWDITTETLDTRTAGPLSGSSVDISNAFQDGSYGGLMYIGHGTSTARNLVKLDCATMEILEDYDIISDWGRNLSGLKYDPLLHAVIGSPSLNNPVYWIYLDRVTPTAVTLKSIIDNISSRVGYTPDVDTDASDHASTFVAGFVIGSRTQSRQPLEQLSEVYQFGAVESDFKIKFPARGSASVLHIPEDDLGVVNYGDDNDPVAVSTRTQEDELPFRVEMTYIDAEIDYQEQMQRATRAAEATNSRRTIQKTYPLVFDNTEARQRIQVMLQGAWLDRVSYKFSLHPKYQRLDPGDVVTVTFRGRSHLITLQKVEIGANGIVRCEGVGSPLAVLAEADDIISQIYTLPAEFVGGDAEGFVPQTLQGINPVIFYLVDIPALRDADYPGTSGSGYYIVADGSLSTASFNGADVQRSADSLNYDSIAFYPASQEATIGITTSVLAEPDYHTIIDPVRWTVFDEVNTVDIVVPESASFSSVSDLEALNGANAFVIGSEIIIAATVTDNGDGNWTLSRLLRGRRGTNYDMGSHVVGERVVYATASTMFIADETLDNLSVSYYYKAFDIHDPGDFSSVTQFTNTGNINRHYGPADVDGSKSGADWVFTWKRRSKFNGEWASFVDVSLEDGPENYTVKILDEDFTVLRTITDIDTATYTYTEADQETDFGSPITGSYPKYRIWIEVLQVGAAVGDGFTTRELIEDFPDPISLDGNYSSVSLLIHCNSLNVKDKSSHRIPITVEAGATLVPGNWYDGISQYGTAVLFLDTGQLRIPRTQLGNLFDFGSGDFTVEMWAHQIGEHLGRVFTIWGGSGDQEFIFGFATTASNFGSLEFTYTTDGNTDKATEFEFAGSPETEDSGLSHYAWVRESDTLSVYKNGVRFGTLDMTGETIFSGGNNDLVIGDSDGNSSSFNGYLDSLRVTKGVARYSGATYTPPEYRFSNG